MLPIEARCFRGFRRAHPPDSEQPSALTGRCGFSGFVFFQPEEARGHRGPQSVVGAGRLAVLHVDVPDDLVDAVAVIHGALQDLGDLAPLAELRMFVERRHHKL